jgi:hypothetical protein
LAVFDVKRERRRVARDWALPFVCYPVGTDVIWIKRSQISGRKDEIATLTLSIDTDRHALSGARRIRKRISIVMVKLTIAKDLTGICGAAAT